MSWMIRRNNNRIEGPMTEGALKQKILKGELQETDEACEANSYWFQMNESKILNERLGVSLPQSNLEGTATDTKSLTKTRTTLGGTDEKTALLERTAIWKVTLAFLLALTMGLLWGVIILLSQ